MRINRTNAVFRAAEREGNSPAGTVEDDACAYFWRELVGELEPSLLTNNIEQWPRKLETPH
jgi:hypothetical protein